MNIFILLEFIGEGTRILGVYDSKDGASSARSRKINNPQNNHRSYGIIKKRVKGIKATMKGIFDTNPKDTGLIARKTVKITI